MSSSLYTRDIVTHHDLYKSLFIIQKDIQNIDDLFKKRYAVAQAGVILGNQIDNISSKERLSYISEYLCSTNLLNPQQILRQILNHTTSIIQSIFKDLGIRPMYVGYAQTCSIGIEQALPGSDVDFLTILLKDNIPWHNFYKPFIEKLNPRILNINTIPLIYTVDEVEEYLEYMRNGSPHIDNYELWERMYKISKIVINIQSKWDILNNLSDKSSERIKAIQDTEGHQKARTSLNIKKHNARKNMISSFRSLTADEQFTIIRILQIHAEGIALDVSEKTPYQNTFNSLLKRNLLTIESEHLKAEWSTYPWIFRNQNLDFYNEVQKTSS